MSINTQIRTLQKAWDMMAEKIADAEFSIEALWKAYGRNKNRTVELEHRISTIERKLKIDRRK